MVDLHDDARKAHEARVKRDADARQTARDELNKSRDEQVRANTEAMRRQTESQPTPTQEENDLARIGQHVLNKEDDGSGPDPSTLSPEEQRKLRERRAAEASGGNAPYRTRTATPHPGSTTTKT